MMKCNNDDTCTAGRFGLSAKNQAKLYVNGPAEACTDAKSKKYRVGPGVGAVRQH